jgi:phosphate transport system permease protein
VDSGYPVQQRDGGAGAGAVYPDDATTGIGRRLANAIVGSLIIVSAAIFIATPVGILAGIYLAEIGRNSTVAKVTRFINDILLSAPSIVIGLFVYTLIVANAKHYSAWAGAVALAIIAVPVIVRRPRTCCNWCPTACVRRRWRWAHRSGGWC